MTLRKIAFFLLVLFFYSCKESPSPSNYNIIKELVSESGMVASAHPLASEIGAEVLKSGGNAVDAATAIQFALAVVYPAAGNLGGGGFMVLRDSSGAVHTLDYREKSPLAGHRDMYLDSAGNAIAEKSRIGHLAVGVPGSVDGILTAQSEFGSMDLSDLIQPSIDLARNGIQLTKIEADKLNKYRADFLNANNWKTPFTRKTEWKDGDMLVQPELAATLERIRDEGRAGFYAGTTATLLLEEMEKGHGIITQKDLDDYQSAWREPLVNRYDPYTIYSMGPPSSGGLVLCQMLEMIEPYRLDTMGFHTPESMHLMVEAERRAYADRAAHMGDMDFYKVPLKMLLDSIYLAEKMSDFDPNSATSSASVAAGEFSLAESEETTHLSVIDRFGNAVALTTTLNASYGSKVVVEGAGFFLNNEMDDFSAKPGVPNLYGLVGGEANAIAPGKRMLSSMTPTIVTKDSKLWLVVGTPGGSTIITSVFQVFVNVSEFGLSLQDAVQANRFHHQWLPDKISIEENEFDPALIKQLEALGHVVEERESIGRLNAILVRPDGKLEGAGDRRSDESVAGD